MKLKYAQLQSRTSTGNTSIYDPFYDVSHMTYENYKFSLLRHKDIKENDENRTYYFRCSNPKRNCSCYLTVYVNTAKCSYEIRPNKSEMTHNEKCIQCSTDESQQISEAIKECRSFTIEFGRRNQGEREGVKIPENIEFFLRWHVLTEM